MRKSKACYQKLRRIIDYNTLNTVQGPTVSIYTVINIASSTFDRKTIDKALSMLQQNQEVFAIKRDGKHKVTLRDDEHLLALIEQELEKETPNRKFIGHVNTLREKT